MPIGELDLQRERLTIDQAAKLAMVARRTIYNWMRMGKVDFCRTAGGHIRIYADSLFQPGRTVTDEGK